VRKLAATSHRSDVAGGFLAFVGGEWAVVAIVRPRTVVFAGGNRRLQNHLERVAAASSAFLISRQKVPRPAKRARITVAGPPVQEFPGFTLSGGELVLAYGQEEALRAFEQLRDMPRTFHAGDTDWLARSGDTPIPQKLGRFPGLTTGQRFAKFFHWRDVLATGKKGKRTAFQVLADPPIALQTTLAVMQPGPERDQTCLKFLREQSSAFAVTQFPAHVAKSLAVIFGASKVLDFSAGWGDRLSGFLAADCVQDITLIEPRASACVAYKQQHGLVQSGKVLCVVQGCAEVQLSLLQPSFDLILSSPPYAAVERYTHTEGEPPQAWQKFKTVQQFQVGFLQPVIVQAARLLNEAGVFVLNVDNCVSAPGLCEFTLKCAVDSGLVLIGTCGLAKSTGKCEPIYLFAKPNNVQWSRQLLQPVQRQVHCADALMWLRQHKDHSLGP
jgi:hypothetical protein